MDHVASQKLYGIVRFLSLIMWIYDIFSKKAWWAIRHSFAYHCIYLWNMQNLCHAKSFWYLMHSLDLWNWGWLSSISDGHDNTILCQHACDSAMECGSGKIKTWINHTNTTILNQEKYFLCKTYLYYSKDIHGQIWHLHTEILNVRKQYVTGCERLWDPLPTMHINSFAHAKR